jgi:hypothetical protein
MSKASAMDAADVHGDVLVVKEADGPVTDARAASPNSSFQ